MKPKAVFKKTKQIASAEFMTQTEVVEKNPFIEPSKQDAYAKKKRLDEISDRLNQTGYFHQMNWPWLHVEFGGIKYPIYVSRYYPALKLALDLTTDSHTDLKEKLCKENGISFFVINNLDDIDVIKKSLGAIN